MTGIPFNCSGKTTTTLPVVLVLVGWSRGNGRYATLVPGSTYGLSLQLTVASNPAPKKKRTS